MTGDTVRDQLLRSVDALVQSTITWAPRVLLGVLAAVGLVLLAKGVERGLRLVLARLRLDALADRIGLSAALAGVGMRQRLSSLLPRITFYLLLFLFAHAAAEGFGLTPISNAIAGFLGYLPNLFSAVLLAMVGSIVAPFAGRTVARAASESGIDSAASLGSLVAALVWLIVGVMAVSQLKIDTDIVRLVAGVLLAALGLAFGLSFGLGTREITRNIIVGFYARKVFRIGEELEVLGERGVLRSITPTQTLLDQAGRTVAVSNSVFLDEIVRQ